eukprot:COSAG06_NODE_4709_length_4022_cov_26.270966_3_plen_618_part_00
MRMSSDDVVERLLKILAQHAAEDAEMRLAASLILYALASDHANLEYFDGPAISFLARLVQAGAQDAAVMALGSAAAAAASPRRVGVFSRGGGLPKIRMGNRMADGKSRKTVKAADSILPQLSELVEDEHSPGEQPSAATFALKTLVELSDQHQLKDEFRATGVLDRLAGMICEDSRRLRAANGGLHNPDAAVVLRSMMPCLHILEKVTFLNEANAAYLVNTASCAEVVAALLDTLAVCDGTETAIGVKAERGDGAGGGDGSGSDSDSHDEQLSSRVIMSVCLRVLVNLTNDQPTGCALVASNDAKAVVVVKQEAAEGGGPRDVGGRSKSGSSDTGSGSGGPGAGTAGLLCVMSGVIVALRYRWHDSLIVALALLVNLLEQNDECCKQLECLEVQPPSLSSQAAAAAAAAAAEETTPNAKAKAKGKAKANGKAGAEVRGQQQLALAIGSTENLLPCPTPALDFFCDLYVSTCGAQAAAAAASMPESQRLEEDDDDSDDENGGGGSSSNLGIVSGYAAVLLGFLCLRRDVSGCAGRVRTRLAAAAASDGDGDADGNGSSVGLVGLIESVRNFGVVHAEAGVLQEAQARLFDEIIATLTQEHERHDGITHGQGNSNGQTS